MDNKSLSISEAVKKVEEALKSIKYGEIIIKVVSIPYRYTINEDGSLSYMGMEIGFNSL